MGHMCIKETHFLKTIYRCSEELITWNDIKPTACDFGDKFCRNACYAKGRQTGICVPMEPGHYNRKKCTCSKEKLQPSQLVLCTFKSICHLDCQAKGKTSGYCDGWNCRCQSDIPDSGEIIAKPATNSY